MQEVSDQSVVFKEELQRVLASAALRSSESLKRLLAYFAEAHVQGTARDLKEYTIGRDAMGKPADYDPRVDASVRVQVGKLRQRMEQYYQSEAPASPWILHLPKGRFELVLEKRPEPASLSQHRAGLWQVAALALAALCVLLTAAVLLLWRRPMVTPLSHEMKQFWEPFLENRRQLTVVLGSPLFVRFHNSYFRHPWSNDWAEAQQNLPLGEMAKLLKSQSPPSETRRWTPFGEASAAFLIAQTLAAHKPEMTLKRSSVLAWEDLRSSNLLILGPPKFNPQLHHLPAQADFVIESPFVKNLRPKPGEAASYTKPQLRVAEDIPEDYAVITRLRALEGWGEILVLESSSTEGTWAAAEYVTESLQLGRMFEKLRTPTGAMPDCYQVLLRCKFKAQVPLQSEYVTHHVLQCGQPARK